MTESPENIIAKEVVDACFQIHTTLGPGLLESVYEEVLDHELTKRGFSVQRQATVPIIYQGIKMKKGFFADLIVEELVILELKSVAEIAPLHSKQLLTYLRLTNCKLGLLINFNVPLIKDGIKRVVNGL